MLFLVGEFRVNHVMHAAAREIEQKPLFVEIKNPVIEARRFAAELVSRTSMELCPKRSQ